MKVLEQIKQAEDAINVVEEKVSKIREESIPHSKLLSELPKKVFNYGYNTIKVFDGKQKDLIKLIDSFEDFRNINDKSMDEYHDKRIELVREHFDMSKHGSFDYVMMYRKSRTDKTILKLPSNGDANCYFRDDRLTNMVYQIIDGVTYYLGTGITLGDSIDRRNYRVSESPIDGLLIATLHLQMVSNVTFEPVSGWGGSYNILVKESEFLKTTEVIDPKIRKAPVTGAYVLEGMAYTDKKLGD